MLNKNFTLKVKNPVTKLTKLNKSKLFEKNI